MVSCVLVSIVVSIPACHAGDRGSIPRRGDVSFFGYGPQLRSGASGDTSLAHRSWLMTEQHALVVQW